MKCDLHVHTVHSGMCTVPVANRFCRECYTQPEALYRKLKRLGMDLVTVTDHDSIDAVEGLRKYPDFFLSVEATCTMPSGTEVHIGVYDITEQQHIVIQQRRHDFLSLLAYLREQRLFFSINHLLSALTGQRHLSDYEWLERAVPAVEILNGAMPESSNRLAAMLGSFLQKAPVAGSDAHTLASAGRAYTSIPAARSKQDYLERLRAGQGIACGQSGGFVALTADVLSICMSMFCERPYLAPIAPVVCAVPLVTLIHCGWEAVFAQRWYEAVSRGRSAGRLIAEAEVSA